jgi:hypothetical protein
LRPLLDIARRTGTTTRTTALIALGALTTTPVALVSGPYGLLVVLGGAAVIQGMLEDLRKAAWWPTPGP